MRTRGFTLIELLVVLALLAVAVGMAALALRDSNASRLEEEAVRLSALLEGARARSRATGTAVTWAPTGAEHTGFAFTGLPANAGLPTQWLDERTQAEVVGAPLLRLGPEPVIGAQQVVLVLEDRRVMLATDGLAPFVVQDAALRAAGP